MTGFDYAVLAVLVLSALLGWWRGLVYEVLSLLGWVAAFLVARQFAADVVPYMPAALGAEAFKVMAASALLFILTLIVGGILAWLLSKVVKWVGLGWLDSLLGTLFGFLRGCVLVLLAIVLAGYTTLPQAPFWHDAWSSKLLVDIVLAGRSWLPEGIAHQLHY